MQNQPDKTEPVGLEYLEQTLRELGEFYYWPNDGNLGDYLIAEATRQLFRRMGVAWKEYNPAFPPRDSGYVLVYGGGGRLVPHWGGMEVFLHHFTLPAVKRCVILPHSIHGVDDFVKALDERHVVFCRERRTLSYCRSLNNQAEFILAHDMGVGLVVDDLPESGDMEVPESDLDAESMAQYQLLSGGAAAHARHRMHRATVELAQSGRKVAFVLRTDREKSAKIESAWAYDLSILYSASCRETPYSAKLVRFMADILNPPDVVVTDRLHVAIMAMHVGKEVYMLDNDYGKLSGVYELSLKGRANVHLLPPGEPWPVELQRAWAKLNSPWRNGYFAARAMAGRILRKIKGK